MGADQRELCILGGGSNHARQRRGQAARCILGRSQAAIVERLGNPRRMLVDAAETGDEFLARHVARCQVETLFHGRLRHFCSRSFDPAPLPRRGLGSIFAA
jgi:hypothetical protein